MEIWVASTVSAPSRVTLLPSAMIASTSLRESTSTRTPVPETAPPEPAIPLPLSEVMPVAPTERVPASTSAPAATSARVPVSEEITAAAPPTPTKPAPAALASPNCALRPTALTSRSPVAFTSVEAAISALTSLVLLITTELEEAPRSRPPVEACASAWARFAIPPLSAPRPSRLALTLASETFSTPPAEAPTSASVVIVTTFAPIETPVDSVIEAL